MQLRALAPEPCRHHWCLDAAASMGAVRGLQLYSHVAFSIMLCRGLGSTQCVSPLDPARGTGVLRRVSEAEPLRLSELSWVWDLCRGHFPETHGPHAQLAGELGVEVTAELLRLP